MSAAILAISIVALLLGYIFYGRFVANRLGVDPSKPTPSHTMHDGVDYCPAKAPVLFGHHFSSIAGAGPIVGPVLAGIAFGWLPALVWIVLGSIFIGGVHDMGDIDFPEAIAEKLGAFGGDVLQQFEDRGLTFTAGQE